MTSRWGGASPAKHTSWTRHRSRRLHASSILSPFTSTMTRPSDSLFSGLVASGWHTAAITMRLLVERGLPLAGGVVGAGGELSWPRPTRPGDVLQVESEVLEIIPSRSRPDRGVARIRSLTRNQRDEVVQILIAKLIVPRRTHQ